MRQSNHVDPEPLLVRRLRYRLWDMFRPSYSVQAGPRTLHVRATSWAASRLPAGWPSTWRVDLMRRVFALRPGAFVDVGANTGQTLIDFVLSGEKRPYFGFEPNPECIEMLNTLIDANRLENVMMAPVGLADADMILKFFVKRNSTADKGGSLMAGLRPDNDLRSLLVPCYRFDTVREQLGVDDISLIKIDVEGAELATLSGMRETIAAEKPWIALEVLHRDSAADVNAHDQRTDALLALIAELGYAVFLLDKPHDEGCVNGLTRVEDFPRIAWTPQNKHLCDYMLVPEADAEQAAQLF